MKKLKLCAQAIMLGAQSCLNDSSDSGEDCEQFIKDILRFRHRRNQRQKDMEQLLELVEPGPSSAKRDIPKVDNYIATIHAYQPDVFKSHFRMTRERVALLEGILYRRFKEITSADGRPNIPLNYRILLSLWTLANQETFRGIADRFGVGVGTAHEIFMETCILINEQTELFIKWPSEYTSLVEGFKTSRSTPFPGVIGAIDGIDIPIVCPRYTDKESYFNKKGTYSLKMQAICDSKRRFLNAFVGYPGACHDAAMWQASGICQLLSGIDSTLPRGYHLIGDSAYPLKSFLMKPFRDNGHLSPKQIYFNKILSSSRIVIENAFGLLKGRFRRLKHLDMHRIKDMSTVITTACVLHNFIEEQNISAGNEEIDFEVVEEEVDSSESEAEDIEDIYIEQNDRDLALMKQHEICERLWAEKHRIA